VLSNVSTIATAASGGNACPTGGGNTGGNSGTTLSQTEINTIAAAGRFRSGNLSMTRTTAYVIQPGVAGLPSTTTSSTSDSADATFIKFEGTGLSSYLGTVGITTYGACTVTKVQGSGFNIPNVTFGTLDAGASIGISGPKGNGTLAKSTAGGFISYDATLPANYLDPGSFTMNIPGGPDVGAFTITAPMPATINWTNRTSLTTVNRAGGVTFTWTGGDANGVVTLDGSSITTTGGITFAGFSCTAKASDGQFTVPASVLNQLPATAAQTIGGITLYTTLGTLSITSTGAQTRAGSVTGLDYATFSGGSSVSQSTIFQ